MIMPYRPMSTIRFPDLFDGSLEQYGISEFIGEHTSSSARCLTDRTGFLWAHEGPPGFVKIFVASRGFIGGIVAAVSYAFDVKIVTRYEPQWWGFETTEEWERKAEEIEAGFYVEMMKQVRDEPNNLSETLDGLEKAEIARSLIVNMPLLASPDRKRELLEAISEVCDREYSFLPPDDEVIAESKKSAIYRIGWLDE